MLVIAREGVECSDDDDVTIMLNSVIQNREEVSQILKGVVQNTRKARAKKNTGEASKDQQEPEEQASTKGKKKTPIPTAGEAQTSSAPVAPAEPKAPAPAAEAMAKPKDTRQYKHAAPIMAEGLTEDLVKRVLNTEITVTIGEICSESAGVRSRVKDVLTNRKVPIGSAAKGSAAVAIEKDAMLIMTLQEGRHMQIMVADRSAGLHALTPTVDGIREVESILDEGCQVVAMSYDVWQKLGLPLDPTIKISLQSANNESDWSEGICHNVPFDFGGLEVLLQVHVVKNAAYDILLGRPFSILTESKIDNRFNGDQLVTLTDPNSGKTVTLPTHERGNPRFSWPNGHISSQPHIHEPRPSPNANFP